MKNKKKRTEKNGKKLTITVILGKKAKFTNQQIVTYVHGLVSC